jgi:hypothetical protein
LLYWLSSHPGQEVDMRPLLFAVCATALCLPFAAIAATATPTPAPKPLPAPTGVAADARCLMTMAAFTGDKDTNTASTAQLGVLYFAGRIKAQNPGYNLATQLKGVAAGMNGQPLKAEADRCGPMVLSVLRELEAAQQAFAPATAGAGAARPPASAPPTGR